MKTVELALKAGRRRQSSFTGFIHHCYENCEQTRETIPLYENFCFVLTLFRSKIADHILEGKRLLERLFIFQTAEGFPIYLHEYPHCKSRRLQQKISVVAHFLLRDFSTILGDSLHSKLKALATPLEQSEDEVEFLIQSQLTGEDPLSLLKHWDAESLCWTEPSKPAAPVASKQHLLQERGEPAVTLLDLIAGEWTGKIPARAVQDHPIHLQASLIYPKLVALAPLARYWKIRFWGEGNPTHSAVLETAGHVSEENNIVWVDLAEQEVYDTFEISYFINRSPGAQFLVAGQKATTFQLGEVVQVRSGGASFDITFSLEPGPMQGKEKFWGHLLLGNRSGQIGCKGNDLHEAFDWQIAIRTVERSKSCRFKITFHAKS